MKKRITNVLLIVFSLVFIISAGFLVDYFIDSKKEKDSYDDLSNLVDDYLNSMEGVDDPLDQEVVILPDYEEDASGKPTPDFVSVKNPATGELVKVLPEYAKVFPLNPDMVGWIRIDSTRVNYPVMQTTDPERLDYYLDHNFYNKESKYGSIYVDELCDVNEPSDNITIYGHNMRDGSMFAALHGYRNEEFFKEHPTIHFDTLSQRHTYEIISVFTTTAIYGEGFIYHAYVNAGNKDSFVRFVSQCKELSLYDTGVDAYYGDKLICLSTCEYTNDEGRLVVVAKCPFPVFRKPSHAPDNALQF